MSAPANKAVFLSYASQDAEAAKRICAALRAAGVEVWFDQNELRGGDAWDAKIRKQIKDCALFVPLISADTNARPEGYFRLEWKLAVDRSHLLADDHPFLFPIVIGEVSDATARLPEKFREVQWTRLRLEETPGELARRVSRLLSDGVQEAERPLRDERARDDAPTKKKKRDDRPAWLKHAWQIMGLVFAVYYLLIGPIWRRTHPKPEKRPVEEVAEAAEAVAAAQKISEAVLGKQAVAELTEKSVAVLAFTNLSDDKGNEYFSDGISEELLNVLAKIPGLKVSARTSAFYFKGKEVPIPEIAQKLGVAYIVEGSVRKSGNQVRITAQLIKAADGFHVWSDTFTRDLKDVFAVQDEIAGLIARNLSLKMGVTSAGSRREVNPEAHRLVLEGRHFWNLRTSEGFAKGEAAFAKAIELDPQFAQAHAGLADVIITRAIFQSYGGLNQIDVSVARKEASQALALDPSLAEAYPSLGATLMWEGRANGAEQEFLKAFALNPNYALAHHWYSIFLEHEGRLDEALVEIDRAIQLDPLAITALSTRERYLLAAQRYPEAEVTDEQLRSLRPDFLLNRGERALALLAVGRRDEALAAARSVVANHDLERRWKNDAEAIYVLRQTGHEAEAADHVAWLLARLPAGSYLRGMALAAGGRWDEALPFLERTPPGLQSLFFWSPVWDPWREDPHFQQLLVKLNCVEAYKVARAIQVRLIKQQLR
jgi:TolB-like protein/Tfp pilus assembly protein PilF